MGFTGSSLYRLPVGAVSCEETPSVVASDHPLLILEPLPEGLPTGGTVGVPVPVMFL